MNQHNRKTHLVSMILNQLGYLIILFGVTLIIPAIVSALYAEYYSLVGFIVSGLICTIGGIFIRKIFISQQEPLQRHALIIASTGWLTLSLIGALPLILIAYLTPIDVANAFCPPGSNYTSSLFAFQNPMHAIFESMSGFTTTGLSMIIHEPSIGKGVLFYRSYMQLLGGAGFIILALAVFGNPNSRVALMLYSTESSGERLNTSIVDTARSIWKIYLGVTLISFLVIFIGTLLILPEYGLINTLFDSVNHALCGQSTGGFSVLDDSIATYQSYAMEMLYVFPMLIGALSIPFYFRVYREKKISLFWTNLQTRWIIAFSVFGSLLISLTLWYAGSASQPLRIGIFQFVSALSTTGWQTCDIHQWDGGSIFLIVLLGMIVGGAAGATVGGLKMIRVALLLKAAWWQVTRLLSSDNSIKVMRFNNQVLLPDEVNREFSKVAGFTVLYLVILLIGTILTYFLMPQGYAIMDAFFESASAQGTVGLSCGITQPNMSPILELIYILQMWIGRLEVIPILVLFRTIWRIKL